MNEGDPTPAEDLARIGCIALALQLPAAGLEDAVESLIEIFKSYGAPGLRALPLTEEVTRRARVAERYEREPLTIDFE